MNRRALIAGVAALVALIAAGLAWRSRQATRERQSLATSVNDENARLRTVARRLTTELSVVAGGAAPMSAAHAASVPIVAQLDARAVRNDPEMQARALETYRVGLLLRYGSFYRAAGLNADQVAAFEQLIVEHEGKKRDIAATAAGMAIDRATAETREAITVDGRRVQVLVDRTIAALGREEEARFKAAQVALLGAAGYEAWQQFEHGAESRDLVKELVGNLALTSAPLSVEQGRQLAAALQELQFSAKIEPGRNDWNAILGRARTILIGAQIAEFEALAGKVQLKHARNELTRQVQAARKSPAAGPTKSPGS